MNPLETLNLALRIWVLILEGMTVEQRQEATKRFLADTGWWRDKFDVLFRSIAKEQAKP